MKSPHGKNYDIDWASDNTEATLIRCHDPDEFIQQFFAKFHDPKVTFLQYKITDYGTVKEPT